MIDCHAHLSLDVFDDDRADVMERARQAGVEAIIVVGEDYPDSLRVLDVCRNHPEMLRPSVGFHPDRFSELHDDPRDDDVDALGALARTHRSRIVGIGEVGLDYWSAKSDDRRAMQRRCLSRMVDLANALDLPVNVHSRSAGHYTLDLLADHQAKRVLMHAFDGKARYAQQAAEDHGWIFSIPPSIVRSPQKQKLVRALPLAALALESDSPVLGPDRGVRNEPANIVHAARCIADLKGVDEETVKDVTTQNAKRLFGLA